MNGEELLRENLNRIQRIALIAGVLAAALSILGAFVSPIQFFYSYLFAFLFWLGIGLGCAAILMLHHLVGGAWGFVIQRTLGNGGKELAADGPALRADFARPALPVRMVEG